MYLIAIVLPPLGALLCGKPFQAILCLVLTCTVIGWIPAAVWACLLVNQRNADRRHREMMAVMGSQPPPAKHRSFRLS